MRLVSLAQKSPVGTEGTRNQSLLLRPVVSGKEIFHTLQWFSLIKIRSKVIVQLFDGLLGNEIAKKTTPRDLQAFYNSLEKFLMRDSFASIEVADSRKRLIWTVYRCLRRHGCLYVRRYRQDSDAFVDSLKLLFKEQACELSANPCTVTKKVVELLAKIGESASADPVSERE